MSLHHTTRALIRLTALLALGAALQAGPARAGSEATRPQAAACTALLPGGDGCLGPGFNTPGGDDASTPLGWAALERKEARRRAEALLAAARPACVLNADALRDAMARGEPLPLPRLAETPACRRWQQTLRQGAAPAAAGG